MYDTEAGNFSGLTTKLAYIILKRDEDECFFNYGYNKEKTALLYLFCKEMIPNAVTATCFTKHLPEILNERRNNEEFSNLFYYLPSTTGRNEDINQFRGNVNLNPIDCSLEFLSSFSKDGVKFQPELLSSEVLEIRNLQVEIMYNFFNHMVKTGNQNMRHFDHLFAITHIDTTDMPWIGPTKKRFVPTKFKLIY